MSEIPIGIDTIKNIRESWNTSFTDPVKHNNRHYCYLIHSLSFPHNDIGDILYAWMANKIGKSRIAQTVDLVAYPKLIYQRLRISCSIIDENHNGTFNFSGLIIKAPFENVISMSSEEDGSIGKEVENFPSLEKRGLITVDELLKQTGRFSYNEVDVTGTTEKGQIRVVGFYMKTDERGFVKDDELEFILQNKARQLKVPVIKIKDQTPQVS